jgi:predicted nucleic acid-binding Zn ribbon protein
VLFVDAATTQWAREVGRSSPVILRRLHALLGNDVVTNLTIRSRQQDKPRDPKTVTRRRTKSRD